MQNIADIRTDYIKSTLQKKDVDKNPIKQFEKWWLQATESNITEQNAMTLATCSSDGVPSARIVLLKEFSDKGFQFFTNYNSQKGKELEENPRASLLFFYKELERQIRITGLVKKISIEESKIYFQSRPINSQIGAIVSPQSQVIESRDWLENEEKKIIEKNKTQQIEKPEHWGGYIVQPVAIEFWQGRPSRLHDRILYTLQNDATWKIDRLAP